MIKMIKSKKNAGNSHTGKVGKHRVISSISSDWSSMPKNGCL